MVGISQFILLKTLLFVKAINTIIALSVQKSKQASESLKGRGANVMFARFLGEFLFPVAPAESAPIRAVARIFFHRGEGNFGPNG